jgi:F0F1-type ATP synthase assembly protein I
MALYSIMVSSCKTHAPPYGSRIVEAASVLAASSGQLDRSPLPLYHPSDGVAGMREEDREPRTSRTVNALRSFAILSGAGITFAASIAIGALGGAWLDRKLGTDPWLMIVGFLIGVVAGFAEMLRMIALASKNGGK